MGKYEKKRNKKSAVWIVAILVLLAVAAAMLLPRTKQRDTGPTAPEATEAAPTEEATAPVQTEAPPQEAAEKALTSAASEAVSGDPAGFPMLLADGKLEVESLFRFDGINPDCGDQEGRNIAAIVLTNRSEAHLAGAKVTAVMPDGTQLEFVATHLPAGKSAMVFSTENVSLASEDVFADVACDAVWEDAADASGLVSVSVTGTRITLTNTSDGDLSELVIYCRCPLGEEYFGGVTYQYTVNDLSVNESTTIDAVDCILGMAEVVRITTGNE